MSIDFAAILVLLVVVSGVIWAFDSYFLAPARARRVQEHKGALSAAARAKQLEPPTVVDYARSFFPIFFIVLLLRSFLVEPFRIPSGSMMPTLLVGDFIVVNKFVYGIRIPVINYKIIELGAPERGDVIVFRYPEDPSTPFIKRVVGLPGDQISYQDKQLYINGDAVPWEPAGLYRGSGKGAGFTGIQLAREALDSTNHEILLDPHRSLRTDVDIVVPEGHYFVLGDNRDNSRDSRFWGTVPDENLIGKAFMIWMNWDGGVDWSRIGEKF